MGLSVVYGESLVGLVSLSFEITGVLSACREGAVRATQGYTGGIVTSIWVQSYCKLADRSSLASHSGLSLILDYPVSPGVSHTLIPEYMSRDLRVHLQHCNKVMTH